MPFFLPEALERLPQSRAFFLYRFSAPSLSPSHPVAGKPSGINARRVPQQESDGLHGDRCGNVLASCEPVIFPSESDTTAFHRRFEVYEKSPSEPEEKGKSIRLINQAELQCRIGRNIVSTANTDALGASLEWKGALSP
ncbi:MAG: hypothetical protein LBR80_05580 [Deltaproteobacteria bacterium]|jgi:hypothetical protein|nr:hypothetical protein [Deltaproteobacteria bacterium]